MRILCFGAGYFGNEFLKEYLPKGKAYGDEIVAFIDNNEERWGKEFEGYPIISPNEIKATEFDFIVITVLTYENEIKNQLLTMGFGNGILYSRDEYRGFCFARTSYSLRYSDTDSYKVNDGIYNEKIVVYTSITGDYDELSDPLFVDDDIDYVCFTNNKSIKSSVWNVEYISDETLDNMHLAKHVKFFPDQWVPEYDTSVWVDGKFQIISDLREYIKKYEKTAPMLCFPHFERDCIYDEAAKCITLKKGIKNDIVSQVADYYHEGYPMDNGMYEMGCIVRNHNDPTVKNLMQQWWEHVEKYSYRDQLSFPYLLWKNQFNVDICDLNINKNSYLYCVKGH